MAPKALITSTFEDVPTVLPCIESIHVQSVHCLCHRVARTNEPKSVAVSLFRIRLCSSSMAGIGEGSMIAFGISLSNSVYLNTLTKEQVS